MSFLGLSTVGVLWRELSSEAWLLKLTFANPLIIGTRSSSKRLNKWFALCIMRNFLNDLMANTDTEMIATRKIALKTKDEMQSGPEQSEFGEGVGKGKVVVKGVVVVVLGVQWMIGHLMLWKVSILHSSKEQGILHVE